MQPKVKAGQGRTVTEGGRNKSAQFGEQKMKRERKEAPGKRANVRTGSKERKPMTSVVL